MIIKNDNHIIVYPMNGDTGLATYIRNAFGNVRLLEKRNIPFSALVEAAKAAKCVGAGVQDFYLDSKNWLFDVPDNWYDQDTDRFYAEFSEPETIGFLEPVRFNTLHIQSKLGNIQTKAPSKVQHTMCVGAFHIPAISWHDIGSGRVCINTFGEEQQISRKELSTELCKAALKQNLTAQQAEFRKELIAKYLKNI